ncbi:MAG: glycine cleavage T C-terminal barrel domain-containing protein, partial [Pseudomonadota bacterium]
LFNGLVATSQNRWPSLAWDILSVNDRLAPFLGAGFYYKTFMWPERAWETIYEPLIRRAAGLGRLSGARDPDRQDKAFAACDLLVIGSGPAGLMAALSAGRAGARVILAETGERFGGRLLAEREDVCGMDAADWASGVVAELATLGNVTLMPRTTVTGAYDGGTYGALEEVAPDCTRPPEGCPRRTFWRIAAERTVLASGALERPLVFPGNDRPGVMLAGAVRAYLHGQAAVPGKRIAVLTATDDGWRTATDLAAAGVEVAMLIDMRRDVRPPSGPWRTVTGGAVVDTAGRHGLREITVRTETARIPVAVDTLAVSGGWDPTLHLTCHLGARPGWDAARSIFLPAPDAVPGMRTAGAVAGEMTTAAALASGAEAAAAALADLGRRAQAIPIPEARATGDAATPMWHPPGRGRAFVDLQNDVTTKDIVQSAAENFRSVEHLKRYTTLGMATDQGKTSNINGLALLAAATGRTIDETGTTTFRPPYTPVSVGALGAGGDGVGFAPERLAPSHADAHAAGAPFAPAGLWHRASYFPAPGEKTWREACDREVTMVRTAVGVADVTTLGKIEVRGADAGTFLDRVYANRISTLAEGRARYAVMLREDGFAMDDGTVARLGPNRFLCSTTTAAAGAVMAHMTFARDCLWPTLDVTLLSATEQWAQFAVAGPKARRVLADLIAEDIGDLPFMGVRDVTVGGVAGRLFRISFSGELGFEIAVPARFGAALWRALCAAAVPLGGGPYGMEALNVLRIEKGFITHAEMHGRVTARDLGLGRMVSPKKDCIGKVMAGRPALIEAERPGLVGLRPKDPKARLVAGAHLVARGANATRTAHRGYITSACHSPTFGHDIALGFYAGGVQRIGVEVEAVDFVRDGGRVLCDVVNPVFFDPEGERVRA